MKQRNNNRSGNIKIFILPAIALLGFALALTVVRNSGKTVPPSVPLTEPASASFDSYVSGSGVIEARGENVGIAAQTSGVVSRLYVAVGDNVKAEDPLFTVDDREAQSLVALRESSVKVTEAQAKDAHAQLDLALGLQDKRALSTDEITKRRNATLIADAKVEEAKSMLQQAKTSLALRTVRAPRDGQVLRVNIRPGEFAPAQAMSSPLIIMGDTNKLWVRVDIDENDAWRVKAGAKATASLRGNKSISAELMFVRFESFVVPKRSLTGDNSERVDTRVLQILYEFEPKGLPVYVGQLMDVFIEATPHG